MHPTRIADLLEPFLRQSPGEEVSVPPPSGARRLTPTDLDHISTYIDILLRWNARINLTAIRDPEQIVTRHFGESLFAALHLFPRPSSVSPVSSSSVPSVSSGVKDVDSAAASEKRPATSDTLADLGSGAGFPGLPIKLWAPQISLTLIESNHKKAAFLRELTRALTLTNVNIRNARAETLAATFDVVTLRAVEHFESILPTAASLVAPSGRLALLIGAPQQPKARSALPTLAWSEPVPIPQSRSRILLIASR